MNIFKNLVNGPGDQTIKFLCEEEYYGFIPEPYPAKKFIPEWFKRLQPKLKDPDKDGPGGLQSSTIKRCPPFLDAMSVGWIIPTAADIEIKTNNDGSYVEYKWQFQGNMMESHGTDQITGHPKLPLPPVKFINHWLIDVPEGWSVMFVPPLNRPNDIFECMSGIVDCDGYYEYVNFPGQILKKNWEGIIPAGTPLVQAIPIKRDNFEIKGNVQPINQQHRERLTNQRKHRNIHESEYRDNIWTKK